METCLAGADEWRGGDGPIALERGPATSPLFDAFFEAVQQAGYELTKDVNGYRQEGFAKFDRTIHRGRRLSAARAYLHPVMQRPNLEVRCRTFVDRIVFEGTRAVGVEVGGRDDPRERGHPLRRRDQLAAAAAALGRRERGELGLGVTSCTTCPASARTSRTISRCTSSTRARSRCRCSRR